MNIQNQQQCLEEWEKEYLQTGDESYIPKEDRDGVLHEVDVLYADMLDLLRLAKAGCLNLRST